MKIAFIGLGNMGLPMAQNLKTAGYDLTVYNRTQAKAQVLAAQGFRLAETPAEAAQNADIAISMVLDDIALETVALGPEGLCQTLAAGALHISMSTISIALSEKLAAAHAENGQLYLAAPVMGRPDAAQNAQLKVLLAGPAKIRAKAMPVLQALGSVVLEMGDDPGQANAVKLGLNFMIAAMLESMGEALGLIERYGVDESQFMEIVNAFFASPVYKNYGAIMTEQRFDPPGATVAMGLKDVNLALQAAQAKGMPLPLAELVREDLRTAIKKGRGKMDWASLALNHKA